MKDTLIGNVVNPEKIYGKSAYEIAVMHGFDGTEEEWLYFLAEQANKIAMVYAEEAAKSEANASAFNISARQHDENAGASARRAETAEAGAKGAEAAATLFAKNALDSQNAAKASETNAKTSETNAKKSEDNAKASEDNAKASEKIAVESAESAAESAKSAHDAGYKAAEEAISDLKISWDEEKTSAIAAIEASKQAMIEEVESEIAEEKESLLEEIEIAAEIVQTTGESETAVMSQKAATEIYTALFDSSFIEKYDGIAWRQGHISNTSGAIDIDTPNRCTFTDYFHFEDSPAFKISVKDGFQYIVHAYSRPHYESWIGQVTEYDDATIILPSKDDIYYKVSIKRDDEADFTPSDVPSDCLEVFCSKPINEVIDEVNDYFPKKDSYLKNNTWIQGGISYTNGSGLTADNRCRSQYMYFGNATIRVKPKEGYKCNIYKYGVLAEPSTFIEAFDKYIEEEVFINCNFNYLRFTVAKLDDSPIAPEDVPVDAIRISYVDSAENYPDYYVNYMGEKVEQIIENMGQVGADGESFVFITDLHWDTGNAKKSPRLVKEILDKTNLNTIICGGDLINHGEKDTERNRILDCVKSFDFYGVPFPVAFGNHDDNSGSQSDLPERWFSRNEVFANIMKPSSNHVNYLTEVDWSFTYDRTGTKTRFLFIDTGTAGTIHEDARQAIYESLKAVPTGYNVIVVAHWLYSVTNAEFTWFGSELVGVLEAYNAKQAITLHGVEYDYSNSNGSVKCIVMGHSHNNAQGVTDGGIPWMLTDSDNYVRSNSEGRAVNTLTEQCFDVVTVNYSTGEIKSVRIGAGSDRAYSDGIWA